MKLRNNNKGVALISVMIVAMIAMILATVVLELTYNSLLSRRVNSRSNKNFYEAEFAVNNVETTLQAVSAYAASMATTDSSKTFSQHAAEAILKSSSLSSTDITASANYSAIADYFFSQMDEDVKKVLGYNNGTTRLLSNDPSTAKFEITGIKQEPGQGGSVTFTVHFKYEGKDSNGNNNGFLTDITTDLVINDVTDRSNPTNFALGSYSMFAGSGATFYNGSSDLSNGQIASFTQEGNAYIGTIDGSADALTIEQMILIFDGMNVFVNGDIRVTNHGGIMFSAMPKKDSEGNTSKPLITIRGTIYLDDTSVLSIAQGCNIVCEDIKVYISQVGEYVSVFDGVAYSSYVADGTNTVTEYPGMFPYMKDDKAEVFAKTPLNYHTDWYSKKTSGCIVYHEGIEQEDGSYLGGKSYVIVPSGDHKNFHKAGDEEMVSVGMTLNCDNQLQGAEAVTNVWDFNDQQFTCDAELASILNVPLLKWQNQQGSNISRDKTQKIAHDTDETIDYNNPVFVNNSSGGNSVLVYPIQSVNKEGPRTSDASLNKFTDKSAFSDYDYEDYASKFTSIKNGDYANVETEIKSTIIPEITKNQVMVLVSQNGLTVQPNNSIKFICTYGNPIVQFNGGESFVGLYISGEHLSYSTMAKGNSISYSILALADADPTFKESLKNLLNELQFTTNYDSSYFRSVQKSGDRYLPNGNSQGTFNALGYEGYRYAYAMGSMNSLFYGGFPSLLEVPDTDQISQYVSMNQKSNYDYVMVQNWKTN